MHDYSIRFRYSTGYVFSSSDAFFRFTFVRTAKLKSQIFSITSSSHLRRLRASRHFSHSLAKVFCVIRFLTQ